MEIVPDLDCIRYLMNHSYFKNFSPTLLLEEYKYEFPISQFICYCVGYIDGYRTVQCIRILNKSPSNKLSSLYIQWFSPDFNEQKSCRFWVNSGVCLKYNFFKFEDKLSFFRSTFIYSSSLKQYYRLSSFYNFIQVEERNPRQETIFHSPTKHYVYRKNYILKNNEPMKERKKKEIKKMCHSFIKKHNLADFLQINYPALFQELNRVVHS